jgi:hypothetical protein
MADKLWQFVEKLAEKTINGGLQWERTPDDGMYQASFPKYTVRLFLRHRNEEPDYIVAILDEEGQIIEEASDVQITNSNNLGRQPFELMAEMYKAARRRAMGVDSALDELISSLDPDVPF